jgi:hypothetical protein
LEKRLFPKIFAWAGSVTWEAELLPSEHKSLSSSPSTTKKKNTCLEELTFIEPTFLFPEINGLSVFLFYLCLAALGFELGACAC